METRQIHVRDLSTVTGIQQYEHCVQSIFFLGLEDFEGTIYLSLESDKFSENVALTNNTFIIGQPMTKFNVTYTCQIYGIVGTGEKIQLSKQFRLIVDKSNTISDEAGEYPIDPNIVNGIDQYITEKESEIDDYVDDVIDSIPSDYTELSDKVYVKDLVSQEIIEPTYLIADGTEASGFTNGEIKTVFIEIEPDTDYTFFAWVTLSNQQYWHRHCFYDENKTFISQVSKSQNNISGLYQVRVVYTSPINAKYIRLSMRSYYDGVFSLFKGAISWNSVEKPIRYTSNVMPHITDRFDVKSIAHAGYTPDENGAPENTLPAFVEAKKHGFDLVECDLTFTSDGVCVLLHDKTINRTGRNADGSEISSTINIRDITYEQALQYDFGVWKGAQYAGTKIPTLVEFLTLCRDLSLYPYIEMKSGDGWTRDEAESVIDMIMESGIIDKCTIISFSYEILGWVKTYNPQIRLGYITNLGTNWTVAIRQAEIFKSGKNQVFIDCRKEVVNPENLEYVTGYQEAPNKGIGLECWTVYTNPQLVFDYVDRLVKGFTTAQYKFDDYMNSKWGVNS